MAIWRSNSTPTAGGQIHVKYEFLSGNEYLTPQVATVVDGARAMMRACLANMQNDNELPQIIEWLKYCFLDPDILLHQEKWKAIAAVLQLTSVGLSALTTIKVMDRPPAADEQGRLTLTRGYNTKHTSWLYKKIYGSATGDIHIDVSSWTRGRRADYAAMVLIHEATHKFAGTEDWSYIDFDDLHFSRPGILAEQALSNADSYSIFIHRASQTPVRPVV